MDIIYLTHPHQFKKEELEPTVLALGFFDGVHIGHQQVIRTAKQIADNKGVMCAVMTFDPHPKEVLSPEKGAMTYITPLNEKIKEIEKLEIDRLYIVKFQLPFSKLTPQQFVDEYIIGLHVVHVIAGFDYTYGALGKGTMETLPFHSRDQFMQTTVEKVECQHEKISSSRIRGLLKNGEVSALPSLLGRHYAVRGKVVHGEKRGRTIGFPTANIALDDRFMLPKIGVYAVTLTIITEDTEHTYQGVCNIGHKPTFHQNKLEQPSIEVHLFDFAGDLYGKEVNLEWCFFIRGEQRFSSVDDLIKQITEDKETARELLSLQSLNK